MSEIISSSNFVSTEAVAESTQEEEIGAEEPLEIFSTADEQMYLNDKGEFNWDAYEAAGGYNNDERKKLDKMYESTLSVIKEREVVNGTVVTINKKEVVVNIGYKSEGVVPAGEFRYNPDLKAGDVVPVFIEQTE
ncbi:MAG: S1 RNA-binding domain-containing protein, partial [Flavobacteriales bacterium]